jgi:isopenicillin N synthase-like dioxygenase
MNTPKLTYYPVIDKLIDSDLEVQENFRKYFNQLGFFYLKDTINAKDNIEEILGNLDNSVDVYYGEEVFTGNRSVFHGTYSRLDNLDNQYVNQYLKLINQLLSFISSAFGYPQEFLQEVSQKNNYGLYFYDREAQYMKFIETVEEHDITILPHVDSSLITIIVSLQGFEGYSKEYDWFSIPDREGYLIVQAGTLLQSLTQNTIKANIHRVRGFDSSRVAFWGNLITV